MGDLKAVELLIKYGADPLTRDGSQDHFGGLYYALQSNNRELIEFFLKQGLSPNDCGQLNGTPVWHEAVKLDDVALFQMLVKYGLHLDSAYYKNAESHRYANVWHTPSVVCIQNGSLALLQYILTNGGDLPREDLRFPDSVDMIFNSISSDWSPDRRKEKMECLKWLIRTGIFDLKIMKNFQNNSSGSWIQNTYPEFLEYVIDNKFLDLNQKILYNYYPIHLLSMSHVNKNSLLKILIQKGANVNLKDGNGSSALHYALLDLETVKILLANGADVNALDRMGRTPLYCFYHTNTNHYKDPEIKRLLVEHGAKEKV